MTSASQYHWSQTAVVSFVVSIVFAVLASVMVMLRIFGRRVKNVPLWADDYAIVASLFFVYPLMALIIFSVTDGNSGRHINEIEPNTLVILLKDLIATEFCWYTSTMLVQIGILFLYLRLFKNKRERIAAYSMMGVVTCWWISGILGILSICRPFSYNWNQNQPGHCGPRITFWSVTAIAHTVIDVVILSLPLPAVWNLHVPRSTRLASSVLFCLGFFICIISGFRLRALLATNFNDLSYTLPPTHTWSMLEPPISITTACLPVARPLLSTCFPSFFPPRSASTAIRKSPTSIQARAGRAETPRHFLRLDEQENFPLKERAGGVAGGGKDGSGSKTAKEERREMEEEEGGSSSGGEDQGRRYGIAC